MNQHGFHQTYETQPSRIMFLNSKDGEKYANSCHFPYVLKEGIEISSTEGVLVSLVSASIPYSFYNIRENLNDTIKVTLSDGNGNHSSSLVIPPGNYTATTLATKLKEKIEAFASGPTVDLPTTVTITHNKTTQKFKFVISQHTLVLHFGNVTSTLHSELGFDGTTDANALTPLTSLTSTNVADVAASVHGVYVRTSLSTRSVMDSQTGGISDILTKIDINTNPGGIISLDPAQATHESLIFTKHIKDIYIRITDERDRLLDLNGLDLQIALKFRFVARRSGNSVQEIVQAPPQLTKNQEKKKRRKERMKHPQRVNELWK